MRRTVLLSVLGLLLFGILLTISGGSNKPVPSLPEEKTSLLPIAGDDFRRGIGRENPISNTAIPDEPVRMEKEASFPPRLWPQPADFPECWSPGPPMSTPSQLDQNASNRATASDAEETLERYLNKLTWSEKVMVLRTLTKFSPGEMLEVFKLYKEGNQEAYRHLDALVASKVSEDDFEKLRTLVNKYR